MCIDHYLEKNNIKDISLSDFEIIATDISTAALKIAKTGQFDAISMMRGLEEKYKNKYFKKSGNLWEIDEKIKKAIKFEQFNLQNSFRSMGKFDLVFFRYVLIYFSDTLKKDIFKKLSESILENGTLFIGASEIYFFMSDLFLTQNYEDGTYYIRRDLA
jgi:chemotaxis protein methyltransferase CheR